MLESRRYRRPVLTNAIVSSDIDGFGEFGELVRHVLSEVLQYLLPAIPHIDHITVMKPQMIMICTGACTLYKSMTLNF